MHMSRTLLFIAAGLMAGISYAADEQSYQLAFYDFLVTQPIEEVADYRHIYAALYRTEDWAKSWRNEFKAPAMLERAGDELTATIRSHDSSELRSVVTTLPIGTYDFDAKGFPINLESMQINFDMADDVRAAKTLTIKKDLFKLLPKQPLVGSVFRIPKTNLPVGQVPVFVYNIQVPEGMKTIGVSPEKAEYVVATTARDRSAVVKLFYTHELQGEDPLDGNDTSGGQEAKKESVLSKGFGFLRKAGKAAQELNQSLAANHAPTKRSEAKDERAWRDALTEYSRGPNADIPGPLLREHGVNRIETRNVRLVGVEFLRPDTQAVIASYGRTE